MVDLTIRGGTIFDGTGHPGFEADLVIDGGKIVLVGDATDIEGTRTWDASGKVVSPGFIDIHSHADFPLYVDGLAQSGIRQGITASVTGNCGHGPAPAPDKELAKQVTIGVNDDWGIGFDWATFEEYLDALFAKGQSMNVAPLVPHGTVRIAAMGYDARPATGKELDTMRSLVDEAMAAGAVGMSSGLEYSPGRYADEAELIALAEVVGRHGGIYATHMRERGDNFEQAVQEALNIGRGGGVPAQLSHLGPRPYAPPGVLDRVLATIHAARADGQEVGIDTFPDPWGPAHLLDLVPPWVYEGSEEEVLDRLRDPRTAVKCRDYVENQGNFLLRLSGFDKFFLSYSRAHPELMSLSLDAISREWDLDVVRTILRLAAADGKDFGSVLIRHIFATEEDLHKLLSDPVCSLGSDGAVTSTEGLLAELKMNRSSFGYAPRTIREYAMDRGLFTPEEAVRKMTSLPADQVRLRDRGRLAEGMAADVVVMDLDNLADLTTDDEPQAYPTGIEMVTVNGEIVFEGGQHTGRRPGQVLGH
jgi:N-acyl-D-amino-acid deacylase